MPLINQQRQKMPLKPKVPEARDGWGQIAGIHMLLYGQSGTGKTTLWATFPGPILALMCSGGNGPGELRSIDTPEYREKISPKIIESSDQIKGFLERLNDYETIILDHVSGLEDLLLKEVTGLSEIPAQKYWGLASQEQYGDVAMKLKTFCRVLLASTKNVVIIGQERTFGDKDDGTEIGSQILGAAVMPSVARWLNPACDYVVQTYKRNRVTVEKYTIRGVEKERKKVTGIDYCLRTESNADYMTKFRVPLAIAQTLPAFIVNPTYEKVRAVIDGQQVEA